MGKVRLVNGTRHGTLDGARGQYGPAHVSFSSVGSELIERQSTITCPECGHQATETMPVDACQIRYECNRCGLEMKPKTGDCCVHCSYGSVPCPPIQAKRLGLSDQSKCGYG